MRRFVMIRALKTPEQTRPHIPNRHRHVCDGFLCEAVVKLMRLITRVQYTRAWP